MYNTILRPLLIYGCECWVLTIKLKSKVQAAEMSVNTNQGSDAARQTNK